jgi:hypothetical protein
MHRAAPHRTRRMALAELEDKLYVTLENPWFSIESHGTNAGWVRLAFGDDGFAEIKGNHSDDNNDDYNINER